MTYVREQTSAELAGHMRSLQKMPGWFDPLSDRLWQEVEALSAENSGLKTGYEAYEQTVKELRAEVEALKKRVADMSPFRGAPLTGPDNKCLACGGYHYGLQGLPCPKMLITASAAMSKGEQA